MELNERIALYKKLWAENGYQHQMHVAIEEMSELTDALLKKERGRAGDGNVINEIADVVICTEQLALHYGIAKVVEMKEAKLRRLQERLDAKVKAAKDGRDGDEGRSEAKGNENTEGDEPKDELV